VRFRGGALSRIAGGCLAALGLLFWFGAACVYFLLVALQGYTEQRGSREQAWTVAETLRAWRETDMPKEAM